MAIEKFARSIFTALVALRWINQNLIRGRTRKTPICRLWAPKQAFVGDRADDCLDALRFGRAANQRSGFWRKGTLCATIAFKCLIKTFPEANPSLLRAAALCHKIFLAVDKNGFRVVRAVAALSLKIWTRFRSLRKFWGAAAKRTEM